MDNNLSTRPLCCKSTNLFLKKQNHGLSMTRLVAIDENYEQLNYQSLIFL